VIGSFIRSRERIDLRVFFFLGCLSSFFNLAASSLDLALRRCRDFADVDREGLGNLTFAKELNALVIVADKTRSDERLAIDSVAVELLKIANVYELEGALEVLVIKTTTRKLTVERHLTAFETDTDTAAGRAFWPLCPLPEVLP